MQSIPFQHMHKKNLLFRTTNVEVSHNMRMRLKGQNAEPHFRFVAYFHVIAISERCFASLYN